ncbi:MAG: gliding motility-associated C-terminal domain-containing protein, partial [Crocinitomicaceae bacterium]|nr:gliding motility-associated C-terminal domain-containing protein [Crocinitomicaceae bacterium]
GYSGVRGSCKIFNAESEHILDLDLGMGGESGIHVPTGFSPNGDGLHDTYSIIVGRDISNFKFHVYDRWGNRMFVSSEEDFKWDGTYKGEKLNAGAYAYMLEVTYEDGTEEIKSGNITLIK